MAFHGLFPKAVRADELPPARRARILGLLAADLDASSAAD